MTCRGARRDVIVLLAPALLAALVVVETSAPEGGELEIDERILGVGARRRRAVARAARRCPPWRVAAAGHRAASAPFSEARAP